LFFPQVSLLLGQDTPAKRRTSTIVEMRNAKDGMLLLVEQEDKDSSSEDEEDEKTGLCAWSDSVWRIVPNTSVYDAGLLQIVTICHKPQCLKTCYTLLSIAFLVLLNAYLQMSFTFRIWTMLEENTNDKRNLLFASGGGACSYASAAKYTNDVVDLQHAGTMPQNWDCGPLFPVLFSNVSWLDVNKDGYWSEDDDFDGTGRKMTAMFSNGGMIETPHLRNAFDAFMHDVKDEELLFQLRYKQNLGKQNKKFTEHWQELTANYSKIPMKWMRLEQPSINLCNNVEPHLCGSLEVRGILNTTVAAHIRAKHGRSNAWMRVDECRDTYKTCVRRFGEVYRAYSKTQREACGDTGTTLDPVASVLITRYAIPDNYDPKTNADAINSMNYKTFLLLILTVWGLAMMDELRQVNSWWFVLLFIPSSETVVEEDDDKIAVKSISNLQKFVIIVLILLPRTIVVVLMSYIGTMFLIETDDYSELILNAVGMGFLMEMDEMLFNGLASDKGKDDIDKLEKIEGKHASHVWWLDITNYALPCILVMAVLSAVSYPEFTAFYEKQGKFVMTSAYNCLCHMEGHSCVAAQIFEGHKGDLVRVPRALF